MPIDNRKRIAEISPNDILELVLRQRREDAFIDFKEVLFHRNYTTEKLEQDKDDFARDVVAFANAQGGHIIVGIKEDEEHRAGELLTMNGDQATRIAGVARDTAIQRVKPNVQLEAQELRMEEDGSKWVVVVYIPEGRSKPHMWAHQGEMRFVVRDNDSKRPMAYDEIKEMFLRSPQEMHMARILGEIQSLRSVIEDFAAKRQG